MTQSVPSSSSGPSSSPQGASILVDLQKQVQAFQAQLAQAKKTNVPAPDQAQVVSIADLPAIDEENEDWDMDGADFLGTGENALSR